jgi:hypothetical protein
MLILASNVESVGFCFTVNLKNVGVILSEKVHGVTSAVESCNPKSIDKRSFFFTVNINSLIL